MPDIKLGSLFDGIGVFPLAASRCGIRPVWASEIEKAPISITKRHFPDMAHLGDITKVDGGKIPPVHVITFGSPCQNLSLIGNRSGLAGAKSSLFYQAFRIIQEMRDATDNLYPAIAVWENVMGAFSTNDRMDFRAVLSAFSDTEVPMPPSGRWGNAGMVRGGTPDVCWRLMDAQYWAGSRRLARRQRIFIVADFRGKRAADILFKPRPIEKILEQPPSSIPDNIEDYYGEDGLLYCGKCHTPKEAFFAKGIVLMGKNKHPVECGCQRTEREKQEALINQQKRIDLVRRLKAEGFSDPAMLDWTFENDNSRSPQMHYAHRYVEQWQTMRSENLGLLLWGGVGTGKSFLAGCIANALMEQEVPVRMTNFARILNELNGSFSGRNDIVDRLCHYPLLIIDDFGMERGTEYALEQIYNIVDSRYHSRKPLIVTTNLTLDEIRYPQDTAHARIYDRLLEMCVPVSCIGVSFRKETAQEKLERLKILIG